MKKYFCKNVFVYFNCLLPEKTIQYVNGKYITITERTHFYQPNIKSFF